MDLFLIGAVDCTDADIQVIIGAVKFVLTLIQWAVPLVLIVLGTVDMFKAVASNDDKATKEAQKKFGKRLIYAVVIFLIPFIIKLVFNFVGDMFGKQGNTAESTIKEFFQCWDQ